MSSGVKVTSFILVTVDFVCFGKGGADGSASAKLICASISISILDKKRYESKKVTQEEIDIL